MAGEGTNFAEVGLLLDSRKDFQKLFCHFSAIFEPSQATFVPNQSQLEQKFDKNRPLSWLYQAIFASVMAPIRPNQAFFAP